MISPSETSQSYFDKVSGPHVLKHSYNKYRCINTNNGISGICLWYTFCKWMYVLFKSLTETSQRVEHCYCIKYCSVIVFRLKTFVTDRVLVNGHNIIKWAFKVFVRETHLFLIRIEIYQCGLLMMSICITPLVHVVMGAKISNHRSAQILCYDGYIWRTIITHHRKDRRRCDF